MTDTLTALTDKLKSVPSIRIGGRRYSTEALHQMDDGKEEWHTELVEIGKVLHWCDLLLRGDEVGRNCFGEYRPGMLLFTTPTICHLCSKDETSIDILFRVPQMAIAFGQNAKKGVPRLCLFALDGLTVVGEDAPFKYWDSTWRDDGKNLKVYSRDGTMGTFTEIMHFDSLYNSNGSMHQICDLYYLGKTTRVDLKFEGNVWGEKNYHPKFTRRHDVIRSSPNDHLEFNDHVYDYPGNHPLEVIRLGKELSGRRLGLRLSPQDPHSVFFLANVLNDKYNGADSAFSAMTDSGGGC